MCGGRSVVTDMEACSWQIVHVTGATTLQDHGC